MTRDKPIDGLVTRRNVQLDAVALCRVGAYEDAKVLAVRMESVPPVLQPQQFDPELAEKLARIGIMLPDGLKGGTADAGEGEVQGARIAGADVPGPVVLAEGGDRGWDRHGRAQLGSETSSSG